MMMHVSMVGDKVSVELHRLSQRPVLMYIWVYIVMVCGDARLECVVIQDSVCEDV